MFLIVNFFVIKYFRFPSQGTLFMMNTTLYKFKYEEQHHEHNHYFCHIVGDF